MTFARSGDETATATAREEVATLGIIGTYHYDDEACARANASAAALVRHLADECQTQGPSFVELYLETLRASVVDELVARGDITRARDVARSQTRDGDLRH